MLFVIELIVIFVVVVCRELLVRVDQTPTVLGYANSVFLRKSEATCNMHVCNDTIQITLSCKYMFRCMHVHVIQAASHVVGWLGEKWY